MYSQIDCASTPRTSSTVSLPIRAFKQKLPHSGQFSTNFASGNPPPADLLFHQMLGRLFQLSKRRNFYAGLHQLCLYRHWKTVKVFPHLRIRFIVIHAMLLSLQIPYLLFTVILLPIPHKKYPEIRVFSNQLL